MAGPFKCQMFFEQVALKAGWTETWYVNATDKPTALGYLKQLAQQRVLGLIYEVNLTWLRVSANLPIAKATPPAKPRARDVLIFPFNTPGQVQSTSGAAVPWLAGLVRWTNDTAEVFKLQEVRGLRGDAYLNDLDKFASAQCGFLIQAMMPVITQFGFGIMHGRTFPKTLVTVTSGMYERITRRATGRPFFLPRGRRT